MEMSRENLSRLWYDWQGSPEQLIHDKTLKAPVRAKNFLGSEKKYRESFLNFAEKFLKKEYKEHDIINVKGKGEGTIVHVHNQEAFEVEFILHNTSTVELVKREEIIF